MEKGLLISHKSFLPTEAACSSLSGFGYAFFLQNVVFDQRVKSESGKYRNIHSRIFLACFSNFQIIKII